MRGEKDADTSWEVVATVTLSDAREQWSLGWIDVRAGDEVSVDVSDVELEGLDRAFAPTSAVDVIVDVTDEGGARLAAPPHRATVSAAGDWLDATTADAEAEAAAERLDPEVLEVLASMNVHPSAVVEVSE